MAAVVVVVLMAVRGSLSGCVCWFDQWGRLAVSAAFETSPSAAATQASTGRAPVAVSLNPASCRAGEPSRRPAGQPASQLTSCLPSCCRSSPSSGGIYAGKWRRFTTTRCAAVANRLRDQQQQRLHVQHLRVEIGPINAVTDRQIYRTTSTKRSCGLGWRTPPSHHHH